jgi:hypothetical protein
MKQLIIICILSFLFLPVVTAQNRRDLIKGYEQFRNQAKQEYRDFRTRANAAYAEFMRRAWQQYESAPEIPAPTVPDPPKPPVIMPENEKDRVPENKPVPYEKIVPVPVVIKQPEPVAPVPEIPEQEEARFNFTVFGTACNVRLSDKERFSLPGCAENAIADAWQILSRVQYNNLIRDCLELRARLNLCDWAYLQLLQQLSSAFFGKESNEAVLLTAFLYSQSGYKVRLARSGTNRLYMLVASRHLIYNMNYYKIDGENFYPLNCREESLFICNNTFPNEQALSLSIEKEQHFSMSAGNKRALTSERYPDITAAVSSNRNLIDFYNTYPQSHVNNDATTKWTFYANTPLSRTVRETLYPALRDAIQGKSEQEAANMLINFVQTAFVYDYDDKIWGGDRPFFADETVYYPFSDCEDRSILFSRLVRDLMNLKVVLLYYPGHLATAVQFNETIPGDYLLVNGKRYLVCDPTCIGANIGRTMPDMDNGRATVVFLE